MITVNNIFYLSIHFVLQFLLYFGFQINGINTRYLATAMLLLVCILFGGVRKRLVLWNSKPTWRLLKNCLIFNITTLLICLILMTGDRSMFTGTFRTFICVVDYILLCSLLPLDLRGKQIHYIIWAYILQSLIIFAAFVSPSILDLIRHFQYDDIMDITNRYLNRGTFRGLALSGDQFYGLTASFGLISIFVMKLYVDSKNVLWLLAFVILFAANMFVGRTGFFGFAAALAYLLLSYEGNRLLRIIKVLTCSLIIVFAIWSLLPNSIKQTLEESVFAYAFQIFYNYKDTGHFTTSSSDRVAEMWQITISPLTFIIGDGIFTNSDGTYYGHVDVGYLRQILYGGVWYLTYSVIATWHILTSYVPKTPFKTYMFEYIVFSYLLITHAKGLSFMYCPEIMMIIIAYYLSRNYNMSVVNK